MRILFAEDNPIEAQLLKNILSKQPQYSVTHADNGAKALEKAKSEVFDLVITDWMMPEMDGMALIKGIHQHCEYRPLVMVISSLDSAHAKEHALRVIGADEYLCKPYDAAAILQSIEVAFLKRDQALPGQQHVMPASVMAGGKASGRQAGAATNSISKNLLWPVIGIACSNGGPVSLKALLNEMKPSNIKAPILVVQHGPEWMLETFVKMLERETNFNVLMAAEGMMPQAGTVYIAPANTHLSVDVQTCTLQLLDSAPENYVKPAADVLFRGISRVAGPYGIGVVLTGLGRDGGLGSQAIEAAGGSVFVQEPKSCTAPYMPQTVLKLKVNAKALELPELGHELGLVSQRLERQLKDKTTNKTL